MPTRSPTVFGAEARIGVRFLISLHRLRALKAASSESTDRRSRARLQRIRTSLKRVKNIKTKATSIHGLADDISQEASAIHEEIREGLSATEDAIQPANSAST